VRRLLAGILLLAALPCAGQSAAPLANSAGTLGERTLNGTQSGLYYLPTYPPVLTTVTATALATPGSITVTPVLSNVASITTVAGSALVDGDYLTIEYDAGLTVPIEFDLSPGDGTSGGRVPYVFTAGDSADDIRDGLITILNGAVPASLTASSGGAATVSIVLDTPGAVGGTLTENVAAGGFAVAGFADPTAATTVTYRLVAHLADGTATEAGAASSTSASTATLSAANFLRLTWPAVTNAAYYSVWRTVSPTSPATTGKIIASTTALTIDDTGLAGGGETAPAANGTGLLSGSIRSTSITPVTASTLLGRGSASSGAAQEITLGTGLTMTGTTLDASALPTQTGLSGRVLTTNGTVASWSTGIQTTASTLHPVADNYSSLGASILRWTQGAFAGPIHLGAQTALGVTTGVDVAYGEPGTLYVGKPRGNQVTVDTGGAIKAGNITAVPLADPGALTITQTYSTGATTVTYVVVAKMADGSHSAGTSGTTTTSMADLSEGTFEGNRITWAQVPGAISYDIYRTVSPTSPATTGKLANVAWNLVTAQYDDFGYAGDGTTPPATNTSGFSTAAQFKLSALNTAPSSAADTGTAGEIRIAADYIYVCVATDTWVRAALATWP